ncbi:hypothetical protein fh0823_24270 [Francisella halioticida]|uniref:hypothetical protein n=1 Tax=Francisella halioticida TaxID=549298 RepID=UPI001AF31EE9|nr:hypothetical protein [Francisella halioticida]BCD92288.1 hypothetical protein fh0823_24270 [Francisella halioticida]
MKQLNLFDNLEEKQKIKVGRPTTITADTIFKVKDDINKGLKNKAIILKHNITERTFFRIKKGDYDYLFEKALNDKIDDFSLDMCS